MDARLLRTHPQAEKVTVSTKAWAFGCPGCAKAFHLRGAYVQPDGALLCPGCDTSPEDMHWCPTCQRAQPAAAFKHPPRTPTVGPLAEIAQEMAKAHTLARLAGIATETFQRECVDCRAVRGAPRSRPCERCGGQFEAKRSDARYCSGKCRVAAHRSH